MPGLRARIHRNPVLRRNVTVTGSCTPLASSDFTGWHQVSSPETGYAFHTRLTHSLKVAQAPHRMAEASA